MITWYRYVVRVRWPDGKETKNWFRTEEDLDSFFEAVPDDAVILSCQSA